MGVVWFSPLSISFLIGFRVLREGFFRKGLGESYQIRCLFVELVIVVL